MSEKMTCEQQLKYIEGLEKKVDDFMLFENIVESEYGNKEMYRLLYLWKKKKDELNQKSN